MGSAAIISHKQTMSKMDSSKEDGEIDDSLYSRQRYVLGDDAMKKLAKSNIFISGMGGIGIEIAKNVVLSGVQSVTVHDTKVTTPEDLGLQFFLREEDSEKKTNRATGCAQRLAELNPYVKIEISNDDLVSSDLQFLKKFQCVVLTDATLDLQIKVDNFCRKQSPQIKFISADVYGLISSLFCDFGSDFNVTDVDGVEPQEFLIGNISKANPAVITVLDYKRHDLQSGDVIELKEINGMVELNGRCFNVEYISSSQLSIDVDTTAYSEYLHGGIACEKKASNRLDFHSLETQLTSPDILLADYVNFDAKLRNFICVQALHCFRRKHSRYPRSDSPEDLTELMNMGTCVNEKLESPMHGKLDDSVFECLLSSRQCSFAPLCAAVGGIAAQEVLKSVTSKFTPIRQWLFLDAVDLKRNGDVTRSGSDVVDEMCPRTGDLVSCIGTDLATKLANLRLFMVGCGAIGCEMLKNFALLGIGTGKDGFITITDNDLIEKSNLNRQFLFRAHHIQKPKSITAANAAKEINPGLNVIARQDKVCPDTENKVYSDAFFKSHDIVVNALDNVEARRYVDSRCVTNLKPLIETGTLGPKGHVQVIVPHMTESYSSQSDPEDESVPYCTLKSFPQSIDHTIQWARDKFSSAFTQKPTMFNKFWAEHKTLKGLKTKLDSDMRIPNEFVPCMSFVRCKPYNWEDCLKIARIRFEKYFNHKAKQLLHVFPLDNVLSDGTLFWQSPKRPPRPIEFDAKNKTHYDFIISTAKLLSRLFGIVLTKENEIQSSIIDVVSSVKVPEFRFSNKKIVTDPNEEKSNEVEEDLGKIEEYKNYLNKLCEDHRSEGKEPCTMYPEIFEKDDDCNSHIDFITAASNLRAEMYHIEPTDRFKTKRIAGKIIPAIATTTAAVAGLATIELVKVVAGHPVDNLRNCFMNLAVPMTVLSIPGQASVTTIKEGLTFTEWDKWEVHGNINFTLQQFINYFQDKYNLKVSMVMEGAKCVYIPFLPGHSKRLQKPLKDFVSNNSNGSGYVDLTLGFEGDGDDDDEELPCPPVRYFY